MNLKLIWQRYLFKEMLKIFFLFLGCFFFLYGMIDYSLHMQDFVLDKKIQFGHLVTYYTAQFIKRAELLIPLALLIATLKTLFSLNTRGELIALQASGVPSRKLLRPLFLLGVLGLGFNLISAEYLLPSSLNQLDKFRKDHFKHARHGNRKDPVHMLTLKDRSKLIYKDEDRLNSVYNDVFWVRSTDEIWHMRTLSTDPSTPDADFVDRLIRNASGNFEKAESYEHYQFPKFRLEVDPTGKGFIPLENRKISELFQLCVKKDKLSAYEYPQALTYLLFKLVIPFLSILVIAAGAPYCLKHHRGLPIFFTYTLALFGFIALFALMDAAVILGENLTFSPYLVILLPITLISLTIGIHYRKSV
jgi:lipopolysaccharide export system permease protein